MRIRSALAALVVWAAVGGCGGAMQGQARESTAPSAAATRAPESEEATESRRAEIERLEQQIDARAGTVPDGEAAGVSPPGVARPQGADGPPTTCEDVCQASGSICRAAARICSLADELDDEWAHGRCRRASRTCTNVRRRSVNACGSC